MSKLIVVLSFLIMLSVSAQARVYIAWSNTQNVLVPSSDHTQPYLPSGQSSLWQLIYAPSGVVYNDVGPGGAATGDNIILDSFVLESTDTSTSYGFPSVSGEWDSDVDSGGMGVGDNFYTRIFQTETPSEGDWYYNGSMQVAEDRSDPTLAPQGYNNPVRPTLSDAGPTGDMTGDEIDNGANGYSFQAVPEPGTMGLLALGLVTLGGAARKRRKTRA